MFPLQQLIRIKLFDQYLTNTVKNRSRRILRLWTDHCEYIVAQRFRRGQQMIFLYRRIWDEQALRRIVQQLRKQVKKKELFSIICCSSFLRNTYTHTRTKVNRLNLVFFIDFVIT